MRFPHMVIERCVGCSSSWPALFANATAPLGLSRTHSRNVGWQSRRWWDMLNHHMRCNAFSVLWPWLEGDCVCVVSSLLSKDAGWEGDLVDQLPYLKINIILRNLSLSLQWLKRKLLPAECTLLVRPKRYSSNLIVYSVLLHCGLVSESSIQKRNLCQPTLWHAYYVHQYTYAVVVWMCDLSRRVLSTFSSFGFDEMKPPRNKSFWSQ